MKCGFHSPSSVLVTWGPAWALTTTACGGLVWLARTCFRYSSRYAPCTSNKPDFSDFTMGYLSSYITDFIQHGLCSMIHHWIQHGLSIIIPHLIQHGLLSYINILTEINKGYYCTWTISQYMNCLTVHEVSHCTWSVSLHMNCLSELTSGHHHAALLSISKVNKQPLANLESLEKSNKSQFLHASTHFHVSPQKHGKM